MSAWCFEWAKVQDMQEDIFMEIDLGKEHLVSGFQSQGPPGALYSKEYISYISLSMDVSLDKDTWSDCCSDSDSPTYFYVDDKRDEINTIQTHGFEKLIAARYIRIKVSTSLRWIGHDEKCFRFEILGCGENSLAQSNLTATAKSPGYIAVEWNTPVVEIPSAEQLRLEGRFYTVTVSYLDNSVMMVKTHNTSDTTYLHPSPLYNTRYTITLTCVHHGVPLLCGEVELLAKPEVSLSCRAHTSFCGEEEEVVFQMPDTVQAIHLGNGSLVVEWNMTRGGWRTRSLLLRVMDGHWAGRILLEKQILSPASQVLVTGLEEGGSYQASFAPSGIEVPAEVGKVTASLAILSARGVRVGWLSLVRLRADVEWSGKIRVSWEPAVARGINTDNILVLLTAGEYRVTLHSGQGTCHTGQFNIYS